MTDRNKINSNFNQATLFLQDIEIKLKKFSHEKRDHFIFTVNSLIDCYMVEKERALLLITSTSQKEKDCMSLIAINATEGETEELIDRLCVFRKLDFEKPVNLAN